MFESESNWSSHNTDLIDYVKPSKSLIHFKTISVCNSCGNPSADPPNDHFFEAPNMTLCESCYLDFTMLNNN